MEMGRCRFCEAVFEHRRINMSSSPAVPNSPNSQTNTILASKTSRGGGVVVVGGC